MSIYRENEGVSIQENVRDRATFHWHKPDGEVHLMFVVGLETVTEKETMSHELQLVGSKKNLDVGLTIGF